PANAVSDAIQRALVESVAVELTYRDARARETVRVVEPIGVVGTRHGWYFAAWCRLREAPRAFRLDRIARATLTGEQITLRSFDATFADLPFELAEPTLM